MSDRAIEGHAREKNVRNLRRFGLALTLVAVSFALAVALYGQLPATIPTHWNAQGVIDGWMPKWRGAFFGPGIGLVICIFLILIEPVRIAEDPDGLGPSYYPTLVAGVCGICLYATLWVLMAGMGWRVDLPSHIAIGVGLLLVVLGNGVWRHLGRGSRGA